MKMTGGGGGRRKKKRNGPQTDEEDEEEEEEDEEEEEEEEPEVQVQPPRPKRSKNQQVHGWEWNRQPIDADDVVDDQNLVASDKALAHLDTVQNQFEQHLKKMAKAKVSVTNFRIAKRCHVDVKLMFETFPPCNE